MQRRSGAISVLLVCLLVSLTTATVAVSQCSDLNHCDPNTCTRLVVAEEDQCVSLGANNSIINATYARFRCEKDVSVCSPTKVFFNNSMCTGTPAETLWTPCGTCLQFPPRRQECEVRNGTFEVRVKSCNDNNCDDCEPFGNSGLPPGVCYAHPGVPGLFLEYDNLHACASVSVSGFDDSECLHYSTAFATLPAQGKCFGGLAVECVSES